MRLDRRRFVGLGLGASAASLLGPASSPAQKGLLTADLRPLRSPGYNQVTVAGGVPLAQQQNTLATLNGFPEDALLRPFRAMGGLPAPGASLGGWYEYLPDYNWRKGDAGFAPGHCFGQWTSAMARLAVAQDDAAAHNRVLRLHTLLGDAISPEFFNLTRFPAYTLDKLNCGLLDAQTILGAPKALTIADKVRRCALPSLPPAAMDRDTMMSWRSDRDKSWHWDESYTLPEILYRLYTAGAGDEYRTMARAYLLDSFFEPLARGDNVLGGLHGYSHVNALCSAMQAWLVDGSRDHLQAALNGYRMIAAQSYATGGWAPDELFEKPGSGKLLASLRSTHNSFETPCGNFAFLKLARYLLQTTRDGAYVDAMERLLWNTMFGALPLQSDGHTFYYADANNSAQRVYSAHRWPCCAGTYTQVAADYGINTWQLGPEGEDSVWVNLYLPSRLRWSQGGAQIALAQDGASPRGDTAGLRLATTRPVHFRLMLRIPAWASSPSLRINGRAHPLRIQKNFAEVDRTWHQGDRIELRLPAALRLEPFPSDGGPPQSDLAALCWGPWVLLPFGPAPTATADQLLSAERIGPTEWRVRRPAGDLFLAPFFAIGDGTYATYIRLV